MTPTPPAVSLIDVDVANWRQVVDVEPLPEQTHWVAPVTRYLCLAHYEGEWHPLAIEVSGRVVGHVMWAEDEADGSTWLGGLVIDARSQGHGYGEAAVLAFLDRFTDSGSANVALSYSPDNEVAKRLYAKVGFEETGEMEGDEIVARYLRSR